MAVLVSPLSGRAWAYGELPLRANQMKPVRDSTYTLAMHPCSSESLAAMLAGLGSPPKRKALRDWRSYLAENCQPSDVETLRSLIEGDTTTNWKAQNATFLALGEIGGEDAVDWLGEAVLTPAVGHKEAFLRHSAAEALGNLGTPEATAKLILALPQESDSHVRQIITQQLGQAADAGSAEVLLVVLKTDESPLARKAAAKALAQLGTSTIPDLAEGLRASELKTRYWSLMALVQMESPEATDAIDASAVDIQALLDEADRAKLVESDRAPTLAVQQAGARQLKGKPLICKLPWIGRRWSRCA